MGVPSSWVFPTVFPCSSSDCAPLVGILQVCWVFVDSQNLLSPTCMASLCFVTWPLRRLWPPSIFQAGFITELVLRPRCEGWVSAETQAEGSSGTGEGMRAPALESHPERDQEEPKGRANSGLLLTWPLTCADSW